MYGSSSSGTITYPVTVVWVFILAVLPALWPLPCQAAQISSQFDVLISLQSEGTVFNAGLCRSSTEVGVFGRAVTVLCSTGEAVGFSGDTMSLPWSETQGSSFRFVAIAPSSVDSLDPKKIYASLGTISSWRIVKLANRDYLELLISW